jgi:hypothetical protein
MPAGLTPKENTPAWLDSDMPQDLPMPAFSHQ